MWSEYENSVCNVHVIKSSVVEERNSHNIYDYNTHKLTLCLPLETFVQVIYGDRWLLRTALALNGRLPPLISYGVISSYLPGLIWPGTVTLQATTTKHARQVWLSSIRSISNRLRTAAIKRASMARAQTLQSKVTDGFGLSQHVTSVLRSSLTV